MLFGCIPRVRHCGVVLCDGLSIVALRGPNAWWALVVLALGVAASYPSALSYGYLANVPELEARIIRANIWMAAVTVAYLTFAFSGRLQKLERTAVGPTNRWASFSHPVLRRHCALRILAAPRLKMCPNPALNRTGRHVASLLDIGAARRLARFVRRRSVPLGVHAASATALGLLRVAAKARRWRTVDGWSLSRSGASCRAPWILA